MEPNAAPQVSASSVAPNLDKAEYAKYLLFFTLLWICLTQGTLHSWILGLLFVPLATWVSVVELRREAVLRTPTISLAGLCRFLPFFIRQSLRGGWECALFAIHPGKKVQPGFLRYATPLPYGRAKLYFLHLISLLPGTVSAAIDGEEILIHALDITADRLPELHECEERVAALFDLTISPHQGGEIIAKQERGQ